MTEKEWQELIPLLDAVEMPDEVREYITAGTLVFLTKRDNGTLEFMCPHHQDTYNDVTLIWHPKDPATFDLSETPFYVKTEHYHDRAHYSPCGDEIEGFDGDDDLTSVDYLELWLQNKPE